MTKQFFLQWFSLICIFIVALVLELAPWPVEFQHFKPAWLALFLLYWILFTPQKISIGCAFILGLIWDLILGSVLGVHSLALSMTTYIIALNLQLLRNISLIQQTLVVILYVYCIRVIVFILEFSIHTANFYWQDIVGAVISGILWPWVFVLFRSIQQKLNF